MLFIYPLDDIPPLPPFPLFLRGEGGEGAPNRKYKNPPPPPVHAWPNLFLFNSHKEWQSTCHTGHMVLKVTITM